MPGHDLVRRESSEIVEDESSRKEWLARLKQELDEARAFIDSRDVPEEVNEVRLRAELIATAASRLKSEDLALAACEIQVRAERRLGILRNRLPAGLQGFAPTPRKFDYAQAQRLRKTGLSLKAVGRELNVSAASIRYAEQKGWPLPRSPELRSPRQDFDHRVGITSEIGHLLAKLGSIDEHLMETTLQAMLAQRKHPTRAALLRLAFKKGMRYIERGIYQLPDGRYVVKCQRDRTMRSKTLHGPSGHDIERARRELALLRGSITGRRKKKVHGDLSKLAADTQQLLGQLDHIASLFSGKSRRCLNSAYGHGTKMEQAIIRAINEASV